jgi:hypothetical protein
MFGNHPSHRMRLTDGHMLALTKVIAQEFAIKLKQRRDKPRRTGSYRRFVRLLKLAEACQ